MTEQFTLRNDPPSPKAQSFESNSKTRQKMLLAGLDCLPGQMDLFPTDGCEQHVVDPAVPGNDEDQHSAS